MNLPAVPERDKHVSSMLSPAVGALVTDLASGLEPMLVVMQRYGLSKQQMKGLLSHDVFRAALVEAKAAFQATANAADRIKVKAQLSVELLMEDMALIAGHPAHPPSARVMAFNAIKNLTGLEKPEPAPQKQRFNLTINLPAGPTDTPTQITIQAESDAQVLDPRDDRDDNRGDDGVLLDETYGHEAVLLPGEPATHEQFKRGAKGYVPREDGPVNIITNRPL